MFLLGCQPVSLSLLIALVNSIKMEDPEFGSPLPPYAD